MLTRAMLVLTGALLLQANKPADPAALFGLRESVEQISMSPDGTKLAYITPRDGQGSALYTVTLDGSEPKLVTVADGDPQRLSHCRWISDRRLVCTIFAMVRADRRNLPVSRLVAVNADGSGFQLLSAGGDEDYAGLGGGAVIDWLPDEKERVLIHTYGVSRVDTTDAEFEEVISARRGAHEFITDGRGHVVIKGMQSVRGATEMVVIPIASTRATTGRSSRPTISSPAKDWTRSPWTAATPGLSRRWMGARHCSGCRSTIRSGRS